MENLDYSPIVSDVDDELELIDEAESEAKSLTAPTPTTQKNNDSSSQPPRISVSQTLGEEYYTISRPPTSPRDRGCFGLFFTIFLLATIFMVIVANQRSSPIEPVESRQASLVPVHYEGEWVSSLMVASTTSFIVSWIILVLILSASIREMLVPFLLYTSMIFQFFIINIFFLSPFPINLLFCVPLLSLFLDFMRRAEYQAGGIFSGNILFWMSEFATSETIVHDKNRKLGLLLVVTTCYFLYSLWWCTGFVYGMTWAGIAELYICILLITFLFIMSNFFHSILSFFFGGWVLGHYCSPEIDKNRFFLLLLMASKSSLGTITHHALTFMCLVPSQVCFAYRANTGTESTNPCIITLSKLVISICRNYNKFGLIVSSVFGLSYSKSCQIAYNELYSSGFFECVHLDASRLLTKSLCVIGSSLVSVLMTMMVSPSPDSWRLFFFVSFMLSYLNISLVLHVMINVSTDAFMLAAVLNPNLLVTEFPIMVHRWQRQAGATLTTNAVSQPRVHFADEVGLELTSFERKV